MGDTSEKLQKDQAGAQFKDSWDKCQIVARIVSFFLTPIVVAIIGYMIQSSLTQRTVSKDYVELAVSVLTAPSEKEDAGLRDWAVKVLNANSPIKFETEIEDKLKSGDLDFPPKASEGLPEMYRVFPMEQWSNCFMVIPEGALSFDRESPASVGTKITITANSMWDECPHLMRLRIDGLTVFETDQSQYTYIWETSAISKGGHILRLEVVPQQVTSSWQEIIPWQEIRPGQETTPWWFTVLELIYTLT